MPALRQRKFLCMSAMGHLFEAKYLTYLQGCWADAASLLPPFSKARGARNEKSKRSLGYYLVIANDVLKGVIQIQNVGLLLKQLDNLVDPLVTPPSEDKTTIPPLTSPVVRLGLDCLSNCIDKRQQPPQPWRQHRT